MKAFAWDIETCPQPLDTLTDAQKRRHEKLLKRQLEKTPDIGPEEASRLVRSVNGFLGWICCISIVRIEGDEIGEPYSIVMGLQEQEDMLLSRFWELAAKLTTAQFVTFNGKRFDVDFLVARTHAHGLHVKNLRMVNKHRYRHRPHADLMGVFDYQYSLDDLCDLLGVVSPKGSMSGADVYPAVKAGRISEVATYCEQDVVATAACYLKMKHMLV